MSDVGATLALLQLGDSFFPSGAASFSWGLETLRADGLLRGAADVEAFVGGQIAQRWSQFDRPAVLAAFRAHGDIERLCAIDREIDAATLSREAREGARRIGIALLKVHDGLGTVGAAAYRDRIAAGEAFGQMAAVHGFVGHATGLDAASTCAMSAYQLGFSIVSAGLRIGLLGHVDAQRILQSQRERIAAIMTADAVAADALHAYAPAAEIAMMRHETGQGRMFAN